MKIELVKGAILKDGEQIGTYNAETNTAYCPQRISPALYAPIKKAIGKKPVYDFGSPNPAATSETPPPAATTAAPESATPPPAAPNPPAKTPAKASKLPEPPQDPQSGDKTPEWARWLRDTDPAAFEKRFAGRVLNID